MNTIFRKLNKFITLMLVIMLLLCCAPTALAQNASAYVSSGSAVAYADPGLSRRVGALPQFGIVTVTGYYGGIAQLNVNGMTVYTPASGLTLVEAVAIDAVTNTVLPIYQSPSVSAAYITVPQGTQMNVVVAYGDWALVEKDGVGGFAMLSGLTPAAAAAPAASAAPAATQAAPAVQNAMDAVVTGADARIYAKNSTSSQCLGTMPVGLQVRVMAVQSGWALVEYAGNYAFCLVSKLTPASAVQQPAATPAPTAVPTPVPTAAPTMQPSTQNAIPGVVSVAVPVYAGYTSGSAYLCTLPVGTQVNVVAVQGVWALIELAGNYGYCAVAALIPASQAPAPTAVPTAVPTAAPTAAPSQSAVIPARVVAADARIYASNSTASACYGVMPVGLQVNVLAVYNGWALVEYAGNRAFCLVSKLVPVTGGESSAPAATKAPSTANAIPGTVMAAVNVYASYSTSSRFLCTLPAGTQVNVLAIQNGWALIEMSGNYGYCAANVLVPTASLPTATTAPTAAPGPTDGYVVETFSATVIQNNVKFYSKASTSSASQSVPIGTNVTVSAYTAQWAYVSLNGVKGYIQISALSRNNYSVLSSGSSGSAVATLEKALLSLGYLDEQPASTYNSSTANAVKLLQSQLGMSATGVADAALLRVLYSGNAPLCSMLSGTYTKGDAGASVRRIQSRLLSLGYLAKTSSVDGDYGNNTYNAVKLFQTANGLTVTGSLDSTTLRRLYSTSAAALPSGKTAADIAVIINPTPGNQQNNSTTISTTLASVTNTYSAGMSAAEKLEYMIYIAQNQLGKPYIYGAEGPSSYDCSGFTSYCYNKIGIKLPRSAANQGYNDKYSRITSVSALKRGDLVYFNTVSDSDLSDHAGIYLGAGYFIHASSGQAKVVVSNLASGYYSGVFSWGHRPMQ